MFAGESAPPRLSGTTWSMTYPGQLPEVLPVDGQGCVFWKACRDVELRAMRPFAFRAQLAQAVLDFPLGADFTAGWRVGTVFAADEKTGAAEMRNSNRSV